MLVAEEDVGERCELFHETALLDNDTDLADVTPVEEVVAWLGKPRA